MRNGCLLYPFIILLSSFAGGALSQSNSEYLESITGEAKGLKLDLGANPAEGAAANAQNSFATPNDPGKQQAGAIEELAPGLEQDKFEELLMNNYMGSYLFYKRLDDSEKKEAYGYYLQNPDPGKLREKIMQLKKR